jgi:hypothetical protein
MAPLPAGIYWQHFTYKPCASLDDEGNDGGLCVPPRVATHAGIFDTADVAALQRSLDALEADAATRVGRFAPGYPFVAHADELGIERDGVVLVTGLFESRAAADGWQAAKETSFASEPVLDAEAAFARLDRPGDVGAYGPRFFATRVRPGSPVPAFDKATVRPPEQPFEHGDGAVRRNTDKKDEPRCMIDGGTVTVFPNAEMLWYEWVPVRCGATRAYVRWTDTRMGATIFVRPSFQVEIIQIVGAMCDSPTFELRPFETDAHVAGAIPRRIGGGPC